MRKAPAPCASASPAEKRPAFHVVERVKCVSIVRRGDAGNLSIRYRLDGRKVFESVNTTDIHHARKVAAARVDELQRVADLSQVVARHDVGQAITDAIEKYSRARTLKHKTDMERAGNRFCTWLVATYRRPVVYWDEVTPSMLRDYIDSMAREGLSGQTIRKYINPMTLASRYMEELDPDSYRPLRVRHPAMKTAKPRKNYLTRDQIETLLRIARADTPEAAQDRRKHPPAPQGELALLLCGLCGLRIREAARLLVVDVDDARGSVNVEDSKNLYSDRVIPVPVWLARRVVELGAGRTYLFPNATDTGPQTGEQDVSKRIGGLFRRAGITGVVPRDLRKSFVNLCVVAGVDTGPLEAYIGHAPHGVMAAHYADYARLDLLRERVVDRVHSFVRSTNVIPPAESAIVEISET